MVAAIDMPVFRAVADPTRRAILDLLAVRDRAVNDLLEPFDMSQPAISQHLRVLREAGLVSERRNGRQRIYKLEAAPLKTIHEWAAHYQKFWTKRLTTLGDYLDAMPDEKSRKRKKKKSRRSRTTR